MVREKGVVVVRCNLRGSVGSFSTGNKKIGERWGEGRGWGGCCILGLCMVVMHS